MSALITLPKQRRQAQLTQIETTLSDMITLTANAKADLEAGTLKQPARADYYRTMLQRIRSLDPLLEGLLS